MALHKPSNNRPPFSPAEKAILTTVLYSDIFNFPLKRDELWRFLISDTKISQNNFSSALRNLLHDHLTAKDSYICLQGKEKIIKRRQTLHKEVEKKLLIAQSAAERLSKISSILFIGISGSLAAQSVSRQDDIDLFIIVKKNTLFTTRFLIFMILEQMHLRRKRGQHVSPDHICANLLIDETAIQWSVKNHDMYTAREIAQIIPLYDVDHTYDRFLQKNSWLSHFVPNIFTTQPLRDFRQKRGRRIKNIASHFLFTPIMEFSFRVLQIGYMHRHKTIETIGKHQLAFHPTDYKIKILGRLKLKMRLFGLLTI